MSENRAARGVPLPTLPQWLLIAVAAGAVFLAWSQWHGPDAGSRVAPGQENATTLTVNHLRDVEAIAKTGRDGVPKLVADLSNESPRVRRNVLLALSQIGPDAEEALGPILDRLGDPDMQTRLNALAAYSNICRDPVPVVAPLLVDDVPEVREAAGKILVAIGRPAVDELVRLLQEGRAAIRVAGLKVLRRIGWENSQPQIEEAVRQLAGGRETAVRMEALLTLAKWGRLAPGEIRDLLEEQYPDEVANSVQMQRSGSRGAALASIVRAGPAAAENLSDVVALLSNERNNAVQVAQALAALRSMKSAALPAAADLLRIAHEVSIEMQIEIGWTLLEIGADRDEIARLMTPHLLDPRRDRFHAGRLLAHASPDEARRQVSRLLPELTADKRETGISVWYAIWGLAPAAAEAVPALTQRLDDQSVGFAASVLGDIGPAAAPAVPALRAALQRHPILKRHPPQSDLSRRQSIFMALGKIGPAAKDAVPDLLAELKNPRFPEPSPPGQPPSELSAISALGLIGDSRPEVISALRLLLSHKNTQVQGAAMSALVRLAPDSPDVFSELMYWLEEHPVANRVGIILAIGKLRTNRQRAVQPLTVELESKLPDVRKAAAWALGQIGPDAKAALPALRGLPAETNSDDDSRVRGISTHPFGSPKARIETARSWDMNVVTYGGLESRLLDARALDDVLCEAIAAIESGKAE